MRTWQMEQRPRQIRGFVFTFAEENSHTVALNDLSDLIK